MSVLVDTNILLRAVQPTHALNSVAIRAVSSLISQSERLLVTPQVFAEFWSAATRPQGNNGLGLSSREALTELTRMEGFFSIVDDSATVYAAWKSLIVRHEVTGVPVHDGRLVAAMDVYGISRILTFNAGDFRRYSHIQILDPHTL
jgi:predicted nucleic acid-binding protein